MNHNITGTNIELSQELRDYVQKRLEHAEKMLAGQEVAQLDIELAFHAGDAGPKYRAECNLSAGKELHRAEARGATLHEAIDLAIHELNSELSRAKDKRVSHMRRGAHRMKEYFRGWRG